MFDPRAEKLKTFRNHGARGGEKQSRRHASGYWIEGLAAKRAAWQKEIDKEIEENKGKR